MKLTWRLFKPQGNWRPHLSVKVELSEFEQSLGTLDIHIEQWALQLSPYNGSSGPKGSPTSKELDGEHQPSPSQLAFHWGKSIGQGTWEDSYNLPLDLENHYLYVPEAMQQLAMAWETAILEAAAREEIVDEGEIGLSDEAKDILAPSAARAKMKPKAEK